MKLCLAPYLRLLLRHLAAVARYLRGVAYYVASPLEKAVGVTSREPLHWSEAI
jgi:hypothetical protein